MNKIELLYLNGKPTLQGAPTGVMLSRVLRITQLASPEGVPLPLPQKAVIRVQSADGQFRLMTVDVAYERTEQDGTMH